MDVVSCRWKFRDVICHVIVLHFMTFRDMKENDLQAIVEWSLNGKITCIACPSLYTFWRKIETDSFVFSLYNLARNPGTTNSSHVFYLRAPLSTRQWFWSPLVIDPHLLFILLVMLIAIRRLAATFGARSSFKKLPKRDVMGADIAQLCDLIAEPAEPLALRLSSNLMIGVAR